MGQKQPGSFRLPSAQGYAAPECLLEGCSILLSSAYAFVFTMPLGVVCWLSGAFELVLVSSNRQWVIASLRSLGQHPPPPGGGGLPSPFLVHDVDVPVQEGAHGQHDIEDEDAAGPSGDWLDGPTPSELSFDLGHRGSHESSTPHMSERPSHRASMDIDGPSVELASTHLLHQHLRDSLQFPQN